MKHALLPLFALSLLFLPATLHAQSFTQAQVQEDLEYLKTQMLTYNPGLAQYSPRFAQRADSLINTVTGELDLLPYYQLVARLGTMAHEGHVTLGRSSDTLHKPIFSGTVPIFPYLVEITDGKAYTRIDLTGNPTLKAGDEIVAINGTPVSDILTKIYQHIPADGNSASNKAHRLSASFPLRYYQFYDQPAEFTIRYRQQGQAGIQEITSPALPWPQMVENAQAVQPAQAAAEENKGASEEEASTAPPAHKVYTLTYEGSTAILTLKTFDRAAVESYKLKAKKFYKEIFKELAAQNVTHLVIDLRNNTGGRLEYAKGMLPYMKQLPAKGWYKQSTSWEGKVKEYAYPKSSKLAFQGKVYVLVNTGTFSAGASLARYLKEYADATVIGQEGGGRYEGYVAGSEQAIYLPHSKVRVGIPRYHTQFPPSSKQATKNRGLLPHHVLAPSPQDLTGATDRALELARKLIAAGN